MVMDRNKYRKELSEMKNTNILAQEERGQLKLDRSDGASKQLKKQ